jgi:murein DD-endopeptidase MepM/ murein hydrolase activator NlpD
LLRQLKKSIVNTGLLTLKGLVLLKKIIIYPFKLLTYLFRFLFKNIFYTILTKIYYQIFRLKNKGLIKNSLLELFWRQPAYSFIFLLVIAISFSGLIGPKRASAMQTKIRKTVISNLIQNEFNTIEEEVLIEEKPLPANSLLAISDKYAEDVVTLEKQLESENGLEILPIDSLYFSEDHDLIIKPVIINDAETGENTENIPLRQEIIYYTIKPGDTVSSIARNFGVTVNTVLWANNLNTYSLLKIGNKLTILPQSGLLYTVKKGDTLAAISRTYDVEMDKIIAANSLGNTLQVGAKLMLPGARKISSPAIRTTSNTSYTGVSVIKDLVNPPAKPSTTKMAWPTEGYRITQYFSWSHPGLDIANKTGTPLYAAEDGKVIISQGGYNGGYGNTILLDHGDGVKTRYGHASKLYVKVGDMVKRGEVIAAMGSTGRSTGPHIHFEVIINGTKYNPLNYIR